MGGKERETKRHFEPIRLESAFNHKLIFARGEALPNDDENGLDGTYIDRDSMSEEIRCGEIPFRFCLEGRDNLSCQAQKIPVHRNVSGVYLLGAMYWGSNFCNCKLRYSDGSEQRAMVYFNDWTSAVIDYSFDVFARNSVAGAFHAQTFGAHKFEMYLTMCRLDADQSKALEYVELPDYYLMHVYAMTLEI